MEAMRDSFAQARSIEIEIIDCSIAMKGTTATANCQLSQVYTPLRGKEQSLRRSARFELARRGGGWVITDY
jgi:hypothetical protein